LRQQHSAATDGEPRTGVAISFQRLERLFVEVERHVTVHEKALLVRERPLEVLVELAVDTGSEQSPLFRCARGRQAEDGEESPEVSWSQVVQHDLQRDGWQAFPQLRLRPLGLRSRVWFLASGWGNTAPACALALRGGAAGGDGVVGGNFGRRRGLLRRRCIRVGGP
jgi:hypothetical protein